MKPVIIAIVACAAGLLAGFLIGAHVSAPSIEGHWETVREFLRIADDPESWKLDENAGFLHISDFPDPDPSLQALVSAGEIEYVDLVFPEVPAKPHATALSMKLCNEMDGILYAAGGDSYTEFKTTGEQPLHLRIWFERRAKNDIKELIELLEKTGRGPDAD